MSRLSVSSSTVRYESPTTQVITHRLALAEAGEAYRLFDSREATKVVLAP